MLPCNEVGDEENFLSSMPLLPRTKSERNLSE